MCSSPPLPVELWGAVLARVADLRSAFALSQVSQALRGLAHSRPWAGVVSLRLQPRVVSGEWRLVDVATGLCVPAEVLHAARPRCSALRRLELVGRRRAICLDVAGAVRPLRETLPPWTPCSRLLTTLVLTEQVAACEETYPLVVAFSASLRRLTLSAHNNSVSLDAPRLWNCVACCYRLQSLHVSYCDMRDSGERWALRPAVRGAVGNLAELESLTLGQYLEYDEDDFLAALNSVRSPRIRHIGFECCGLMETISGGAPVPAAFAHITSLKLIVTFIAGAHIVAVMPRLKEIHVYEVNRRLLLSGALELLDALKGVGGRLLLVNDISDVGVHAYQRRRVYRVDAMRRMVRKFRAEHSLVSLIEQDHPAPEVGERRVLRLVMTDLRAEVVIDTVYRFYPGRHD